MLRIVLVALVAAAVWLIALAAVRAVRGRQIDWRGIGLAVAFVALAFWLRDLTDIG